MHGRRVHLFPIPFDGLAYCARQNPIHEGRNLENFSQLPKNSSVELENDKFAFEKRKRGSAYWGSKPHVTNTIKIFLLNFSIATGSAWQA